MLVSFFSFTFFPLIEIWWKILIYSFFAHFSVYSLNTRATTGLSISRFIVMFKSMIIIQTILILLLLITHGYSNEPHKSVSYQAATFIKPRANIMRRLNPLKLLFTVAHVPQEFHYSIEWNWLLKYPVLSGIDRSLTKSIAKCTYGWFHGIPAITSSGSWQKLTVFILKFLEYVKNSMQRCYIQIWLLVLTRFYWCRVKPNQSSSRVSSVKYDFHKIFIVPPPYEPVLIEKCCKLPAYE